LKIRNPLLVRFAASAFTAGMWLLFRTLKLEFREDSPDANPYSPSTRDCFLYCVWHDSMLIPAFGGKHRRTAALISQHRDGSFVAQVLRLLGMTTIRGSTNRIGLGTIRTLIKTAADKHIVITPDGPRGPRREMSLGIAYLASRTGRAVLPTAYSCTRFWKIPGSWTELIIPKPFSTVFLLGAAPIKVPADLDNTQLREHAALIQAAMDRLDAKAQRLVNGAESGDEHDVPGAGADQNGDEKSVSSCTERRAPSISTQNSANDGVGGRDVTPDME